MFLNGSILQANGKESQKELHAFWATLNVLLMATAKQKKKKKEKEKRQSNILMSTCD